MPEPPRAASEDQRVLKGRCPHRRSTASRSSDCRCLRAWRAGRPHRFHGQACGGVTGSPRPRSPSLSLPHERGPLWEHAEPVRDRRYVHLGSAAQELHYSAAGHPPMLLLTRGRITEVESNGLMLGAFDFAPPQRHPPPGTRRPPLAPHRRDHRSRQRCRTLLRTRCPLRSSAKD